MDKTEIIEEIRDDLMVLRSKQPHIVKMPCINVETETINNKEQYTFKDIKFDEDDKEPIKLLLNTDYYIELIYAMIGIEWTEYKVKIIDFDFTNSKSIVEFNDLVYIYQNWMVTIYAMIFIK